MKKLFGILFIGLSLLAFSHACSLIQNKPQQNNPSQNDQQYQDQQQDSQPIPVNPSHS